ncbi:MAG TPA: T9SS type A sorting domain-containing protein [bacterium]|nr:T9SS type A sorting domain-containing protein [bacterium]
MKNIVKYLLIIAFTAATVPAAAQDTTDYGRKVDIIVDFDFENVDYSNEEEGRIAGQYSSLLEMSKYWPDWSPDGKWIAFTLRWPATSNWIVSPEGGEPVLINDIYGNLVRFSYDSKEVIYNSGDILEENNIEYPVTFIESYNLETGERRIIIDEGLNFCISRDGRYICYINFDYRIYTDESQVERYGVPTVYDTETEETWYLTSEEKTTWYETDDGTTLGRWYQNMTFSPDNSHIVISIYDYEQESTQLYKIPFESGEPEQLTFYDENDPYTKSRNNPEYSPDGIWILYNEYSYTDNEEWPYFTVNRMCVFNTVTGNIYKVFENATRSNGYGSWSPDGTQICYCLVNEERLFDIYICDFNPDNLQKPLSVEAEKPSSFAILGNYPNPFNPNTTIEFSLPKAGFVSLVVYDITGQKIRELVSGDMIHGIHSVVWNGRDENGIAVSSGVYISRLRMGDKIESHGMMLVK